MPLVFRFGYVINKIFKSFQNADKENVRLSDFRIEEATVKAIHFIN